MTSHDPQVISASSSDMPAPRQADPPGIDREARLVAQAYRSHLLADVARRCAGTLDPDDLAAAAVEGAREFAAADTVTLWLRPDTIDVRPGSAPHDARREAGGRQADLLAVAEASLNGVSLHPPVPPITAAVRFAAAGSEELALPMEIEHGHLTVPLAAPAGKDAPLGVLEITTREPVASPEELQDGLQVLAATVSASLEIVRLHRAVQESSQRDPLTGLFNRGRLDGDLALEVSLAGRHDTEVGFVMVDVDHFKALNDTRGHQAGDAVLRRLGAVLTGSLRGSDTAYRYGGEEFALLLRRSGRAATGHVAERVRAAVARDLADVAVTVSLGAASLPGCAATADGLVRAADHALYAAKAAGRNAVRVAPRIATRRSAGAS